MFIDKDPFLIAYVGSHNGTCLDVALNDCMPRETVPMLRLLLANSADPSKLTPLMWKALSSSYPEAVEELPLKVDFLRTAIYGGSLEMVHHLVDSDASVNPTFFMTQYFWGKMTSWPFSLNGVPIQPSQMAIQTRPHWKPPR